jgi:type I restriction enzyme S subunit
MTTATLQEIELAPPQRKWPRYPRHKATGVDWLEEMPTHWTIKRLRYFVTFPTKTEIRGLPPDTSVSFVPMEAVGEYGGLTLEQTRPLEDVLKGYTYFRNGDVVVAKITPCFENGKGALAEELENGVGFGTTELHVLRAGPEMLPGYLFYLTLGEHFRKLGTAEMYGAGGQKRVPERFLRNLRHPIPQPVEQRAIAAFLDRETARIDELIAKKERMAALVRSKRATLISVAVTRGVDGSLPLQETNVPWFGAIPKHWTLHHLRRCVSRFIDYRGRTPTKTDSGIPLITAGAIKDGEIKHVLAPEYIAEADLEDWMSRGKPEIGDLVITTEAPLGEVAQVTDTDIALAQRVILFKVNRQRVTPGFLRYFYLSECGRAELSSRASGSTASGIRADRLRASLVIIPSLKEQELIVTKLDSELERVIRPLSSISEAIARLHDYRSAIITAAVTGQIDVRTYCAEGACP